MGCRVATNAGRYGKSGLSKPVIGLSGGVGSGKSAAARAMAARGCGIVDSDALASAALAEPTVVERVREWWGAGVVDGAGQIDRRAVAQIVFNRPDELAKLEGLVHPVVRAARLRRRVELDGDPEVTAIVEDCPLLFEKRIDATCDVTVFVDAPREARAARVAAARGWPAEELERREKNQWPLDTKRGAADYVVYNDAGEAELQAQVDRVLSEVLPPTLPRPAKPL